MIGVDHTSPRDVTILISGSFQGIFKIFQEPLRRFSVIYVMFLEYIFMIRNRDRKNYVRSIYSQAIF